MSSDGKSASSKTGPTVTVQIVQDPTDQPGLRRHYFHVELLQGRKSCLSCGLICQQHLFTGRWIYAVVRPGTAEVTDFEERRSEPACPGWWTGVLPPEVP